MLLTISLLSSYHFLDFKLNTVISLVRTAVSTVTTYCTVLSKVSLLSSVRSYYSSQTFVYNFFRSCHERQYIQTYKMHTNINT